MTVLNTQPVLAKDLIERTLRFMQEALLVFNTSHCIILVNNAALELLGYSNEIELLGRPAEDIFAHSNDADNFLKNAMQQNPVAHREGAFRKADTKKFTGSYSVSVIRDEAGEVEATVIIIQNISKRKEVEERLAEYARRLEKSNKELDQFSFIVSHDLKAPLRAISNLSLWLIEDLGATLPEDSRKNLDMMRSRVARMESLINGILEYSKIGRTHVAPESFNLSELITEILELLSPSAHIKVLFSEEMPAVITPKILLQQVLSNLISNAIKYTDKKEPVITLSVVSNELFYEFTVEDNGPGIALEYHDKIFLIFQTLQSKDTFESTGIGLTIVKRIVEEQGGKIRLESDVGEGCKFIFTWPISVPELTISK